MVSQIKEGYDRQLTKYSTKDNETQLLPVQVRGSEVSN